MFIKVRWVIFYLIFDIYKCQNIFFQSSSHSCWNNLSNEAKQNLQYNNLNDGEFWMPYDEWIRIFDNCRICYLVNKIKKTFYYFEHFLKATFILIINICRTRYGNHLKACGNMETQTTCNLNLRSMKLNVTFKLDF